MLLNQKKRHIISDIMFSKYKVQSQTVLDKEWWQTVHNDDKFVVELFIFHLVSLVWLDLRVPNKKKVPGLVDRSSGRAL